MEGMKKGRRERTGWLRGGKKRGRGVVGAKKESERISLKVEEGAALEVVQQCNMMQFLLFWSCLLWLFTSSPSHHYHQFHSHRHIFLGVHPLFTLRIPGLFFCFLLDRCFTPFIHYFNCSLCVSHRKSFPVLPNINGCQDMWDTADNLSFI